MSQCLTCKKAMSCTLDWKNQGNWISCTAYVQPVTNSDRIRSMTDEELAKFMALNTDCYYCRAKDNDRCASLATTPCGDIWLDWLKQAAEEGE